MHIYSVQVGLFKCSDLKKQFHRLKKKKRKNDRCRVKNGKRRWRKGV